MDLSKLKLNKFRHFKIANFPRSIDLGLDSTDADIEVVIYYVASREDVKKFVSSCNSISLPKENRTIMIFQKGSKELSRDMIIGPFRKGTYPNFKLKAPMLCSISNEPSAFVLSKVE